jgi:NAD(P)H-hydrate epimerase
MGALRTGAGLVYLAVPQSIYEIEAVKLLEPIVIPLPDASGKLSASATTPISSLLDGKNAVLLGPGLGRSEGVSVVTKFVLENFSYPIVLDADGINAVCKHKDILRERTAATILTPHEGEFSRLKGSPCTDRV